MKWTQRVRCRCIRCLAAATRHQATSSASQAASASASAPTAAATMLPDLGLLPAPSSLPACPPSPVCRYPGMGYDPSYQPQPAGGVYNMPAYGAEVRPGLAQLSPQ
jgi:hypothetical protein